MSITATNKNTMIEVDMVTYIEGLGYDVEHDPQLKNVGEHIINHIKKDFQCPSCGAQRPILVKGGVRGDGLLSSQPHLRFVDSEGRESHHQYCEYHSRFRRDSPKDMSGFFLNPDRFSQWSATKEVARLTSVGLELGLFSRMDMVEFREYFFRIYKEGAVRLEGSDEQIKSYQFFSSLVDKGEYRHPLLRSVIAHKKAGFDSSRYSIDRLRKAFARRSYVPVRLRDVSSEFFASQKLSKVFFPSYHKATPFRKNNVGVCYLHALSGLILFASDWNLEIARGKARDIVSFDGSLKSYANVMGFSPFVKFEDNCMKLCINEVSKDMVDILS